MFHVQCRGCGTSAFVDCSCPPEVRTAGVHLDRCQMADPDASVICPPGSCCQQDHSGDPERRGHAVLHCPADHTGAPCPRPTSCPIHQSLQAHYTAMAAAAAAHDGPTQHAFTLLGEPAASCPGGHHGLGVSGCLVCRELVITAIGGAVLQRTQP